MANRPVPYGAFNYIINFDASDATIAGFSDVSGLGTEISISEYRNGNEKVNHPRKIPNTYKVSDVTLKRGIIDSDALWQWVDETRKVGPAAKKTVTITLQDEAHSDVMTWTLSGVVPMKWTGPTLAAKGGGDVAMEELVLSAENLEMEISG